MKRKNESHGIFLVTLGCDSLDQLVFVLHLKSTQSSGEKNNGNWQNQESVKYLLFFLLIF